MFVEDIKTCNLEDLIGRILTIKSYYCDNQEIIAAKDVDTGDFLS